MNLGRFSIGLKVFAIIVVMGAVIAVVAGTGINALGNLYDISKRLDDAGKQATNGARLTQLVTSLNRAEFRIAADPDRDNVSTLKQAIIRERTEFESRLADAKSGAGPERLATLMEIEQSYRSYLSDVEETIGLAERTGSQVRMDAMQAEIAETVRRHRETARNLNVLIEGYGRIVDDRANALTNEASRTYQNIHRALIVISIGGLVLGAVMGFIIARFGIVSPIRKIVAALRELSGGNLDVTVYGSDRKDEIGAIAEAMQVFKDNMIRNREMEREAEAAEERAEAEKRKIMIDLADRFEQNLGGIVTIVSSAATELEAAAETLATTLDETNAQANTVAAAATQASTNVETVATACEQMAASVREIAQQVQQSTEISGRAVDTADQTRAEAEGLVMTTQKIGEVVNLIREITEQTNLLALNATIEAARAGEAGKGFAVVASEVKSLASQTARATEGITAQIDQVQSVAQNTAAAIQNIATVISENRNVAGAIASAVEEQDAATQEIARNVQQASSGTQEVSGAIVQVSEAASEGGSAANQVLSSAKELSQSATRLREEVSAFLTQVRAA